MRGAQVAWGGILRATVAEITPSRRAIWVVGPSPQWDTPAKSEDLPEGFRVVRVASSACRPAPSS